MPPLVYAVLGSSRDIAIGPVAVASLLLASILSKDVSPTDNPKLYFQMALTSCLFSGLLQAGLGLLRYKQIWLCIVNKVTFEEAETTLTN